ncbi:MAG: hypothetical protein EBU69_00550, partial [Methylophilaceae bacterium]|nr:hypothetical protein [Methylophilaceae bacterium]
AMKLKTEPFALESPLPIGYPLFLTYSDELCRKAKVRLRNLLVVQHGVSRAVAERVAELVCTTVEHQVCKVLNIAPRPRRRPTGGNIKKIDEDETDWGHFQNWWSRTSGGAHSRGGLDPTEVYRVLRMFVFGYLPTDRSATDEEKSEAQDRRQRRQKTHDVSEELLASCFNIWAEYQQQLRRDVRTPFAERTEEAIRRLADEPEKHAVWSHILCDEVQDLTDIDWRLVAAISYQESHWDQYNTSPTNVRGMMMLTEETADELGVTDRLDAKQSILGGARYINQLKKQIPERIPEPDRTWMTLAAYNIGFSHLEDARVLADRMKLNPDSWADVKTTLPLLNKSEYYSKAKFGYANGGAPVIFVESIRTYFDILEKYAPAHQSLLPNFNLGPSFK